MKRITTDPDILLNFGYACICKRVQWYRKSLLQLERGKCSRGVISEIKECEAFFRSPMLSIYSCGNMEDGEALIRDIKTHLHTGGHFIHGNGD